MRVELEPAIILHRRVWRDTSLLLEAYTQNYGRIGLIARGARKPKSKYHGLLEPLTELELSWSGRGELKNLIGAELIQASQLTGNALWGGFYAAELLLRLSAREDNNPNLFFNLKKLLTTLRAQAPSILVTRYYERDLLFYLGYGLPLTNDPQTGYPISPDRTYYWHSQQGLSDEPVAGESVQVSGQVLLELDQGQLKSRAHIMAARDVLRQALAVHLGPRPLKTVQMLHAMQQFKNLNGTQP